MDTCLPTVWSQVAFLNKPCKGNWATSCKSNTSHSCKLVVEERYVAREATQSHRLFFHRLLNINCWRDLYASLKEPTRRLPQSFWFHCGWQSQTRIWRPTSSVWVLRSLRKWSKSSAHHSYDQYISVIWSNTENRLTDSFKNIEARREMLILILISEGMLCLWLPKARNIVSMARK